VLTALESYCECGNEPSVSVICWETTKWLHNGGPEKSSILYIVI
jgi:hypothetical protein